MVTPLIGLEIEDKFHNRTQGVYIAAAANIHMSFSFEIRKETRAELSIQFNKRSKRNEVSKS